MLLPVLVPYQHVRQARLFGNEERKLRFTRIQMTEARHKCEFSRVFLGKSMQNRRSHYLSSDMRQMHTHVVDRPAPERHSVILPLLAQDIQRGRGALIMDAKGDRRLQ